MKPRNHVVGFLVSHPNRGVKKHIDKKKALRVPTARMIRDWIDQEKSKGNDDGLSK